MPKEQVTIIDRDVLKVLSTDTRMDILKILKDGKRMPSFVAKKLGKSDATIIEHLHTMMDAGLVQKTAAPGKKWVFYSLTDRGMGIASSKPRQLVIILSTSLLAFGLGIGTMFGNLYGSRTFGAASEAPMLEIAQDTAAKTVPIMFTPDIMTVSGALIVLSVLGLAYYVYRRSKMDDDMMEVMR